MPSSTSLSDAEKSATAGYVKTIQALNYLMILNSHTQDSIPIVTDTAVAAPPAPFQTRATVFAHVVTLLDGAVTDLQAGGTAFPFALPAGFTGFNTPANFILFNRGLRARVAVYSGDSTGALTALAAAFVDVPGPLALGVYMDYGTGAGDTPNPLSIDPQQGENFAHPSLETGALLGPDPDDLADDGELWRVMCPPTELHKVRTAIEGALEDMVLSGINRIFSMETPSGGFSYWPGGTEPVEWGTAYATHMLLDAKKS